MDSRAIGIFDSGCGGLSVFKEVKKLLPQENLIYLGDTKYVPYGDRSKEEILELSIRSLSFLCSMDVKLILIACHTVSTSVYEELKKGISVPLMNMVGPSLSLLEKTTQLMILGTAATLSSGEYQKQISQTFPQITLHTKACPSFVPLIEKKHIHPLLALQAAHEELGNLATQQIDSVLLACTHYPLLTQYIRPYFPPHSKILNPATACAYETKTYLQQANQLGSCEHPEELFFVSGDVCSFSILKKKLYANSKQICQI